MGCGCQKNRQAGQTTTAAGRETWEVVAAAGNVVYTTTSKDTAQTVSGRYKGSTVRQKGAPAAAGATSS